MSTVTPLPHRKTRPPRFSNRLSSIGGRPALVAVAAAAAVAIGAVAIAAWPHAGYELAAKDRPSTAQPLDGPPLTLPATDGHDGFSITLPAGGVVLPAGPGGTASRNGDRFVVGAYGAGRVRPLLWSTDFGSRTGTADDAIAAIRSAPSPVDTIDASTHCGSPWRTRIANEPAAAVECSVGANGLMLREYRVIHAGRLYGLMIKRDVFAADDKLMLDEGLTALASWSWQS